MNSVFNDLSPKNISKMFLCNNLVHPYNTRSSNKYHYHKVNTQSLLYSVRHNGPRIWNDLSRELRYCTLQSAFKAQLKKILLSSYSN